MYLYIYDLINVNFFKLRLFILYPELHNNSLNDLFIKKITNITKIIKNYELNKMFYHFIIVDIHICPLHLKFVE